MQLVRKLLWPLGFLYGIVVWIRNRAFDLGILKSTPSVVPSICIGNLSLGGTGKTPMVEYFIRLLSSEYKLAVLSRGYKRKTKGFVLADDLSSVESLGDEPFQIYSKFPKLNLAVDSDRVHGVKELQKRLQPQLVLLDDAYQHRKIKADINVLLTTYQKLFVDDFYVPVGTLRDHKKEQQRADIVVVTKCPKQMGQQEQQQIQQKLKLKPSQSLFFSSIGYADNVKSVSESMALNEFIKQPFHLVTGIANPDPLLGFLKEKGANFTHKAYSDHHNFSSTEINDIKSKGVVLTTEKDFVRLKDRIDQLYYLEIAHNFYEAEDFKQQVLSLIHPLLKE